MKVIDVRDTLLWKHLLPKLRTQEEEISLMLDLQSVADQLGDDFDGRATSLSGAFAWSLTMQGAVFWMKRHDELNKRKDRVPPSTEQGEMPS